MTSTSLLSSAPPNIGGRYGLHYDYYNHVLEDITLSSNKDYIYQYLNPGPDNDRVITLDTANAKAGDRFVIMNIANGSFTTCFEIKQGAETLDKIYSNVIKKFIFEEPIPPATVGEWRGANQGTRPRDNFAGIGIGENANPQECGVAIGRVVDAHLDGIAIGNIALGYLYGVGIGFRAEGYNRGVAIGDNCHGENNGVAIGQTSNSNDLCSIAIGFRSKNTRDRELAINIGDEVEDDMEDRLQQTVIGSWVRKTTDSTPTTMYVDGSATSRFTIRPQSALTFKIMVTARDNTNNHCAAYLFDGLIKRDGANNTTLCICNKTILYNTDDTSWKCDVAEDDTNEALQITITGDADNTVRWAARLDGVETSFVAA